jgi:MOSC domain-containing protein YiiM
MSELLAIYLTPMGGSPMQAVEQAEALSGLGLAGDRYALGHGTWSAKPQWHSEITLIECEALAALEREKGLVLAPGAHRRNLVTRGVALNHLVEREFTIGVVRLLGLRLCEPCKYLDEKTEHGVRDALVHRGGLRAQVLQGGLLRIGDPIVF